MSPDIKEQLVKYGYFSEQLPPIFSADNFYKVYSELLGVNQKGTYECTTFTVSKNDQSRRVIKIPNPARQIQLIDYLVTEQKVLEEKFLANKHSLSNPFYYNSERYEDFTFFNLPLLRELKPNMIKSTYVENLKEKMNESMGYQFCYRIDVANFYDSIYTHSIEWAIIGRDVAKKNIKKKEGNLGREIDILVRRTNSDETSGIPTGPFTSRIISELILVRINEDIEKLSERHAVDFKFTHYVDDYEFYFRSEHDVHKIKNKIIEVFEFYRLKINENKTELVRYPYHSIRDIRSEFEYYIEKNKVNPDEHLIRLLFFKADEFVRVGEKGAYKYLYKMLNKVDLSNNWSTVEPFLIGHLLIQPSISQYIVGLILKYIDLISDNLRQELYRNLEFSMNNHLHNESHWLLWALMKINYKFSAVDLEKLYKVCDDDVLKITLLTVIYNTSKNKGKRLSKLLQQEIELLETLSFESDRWLLMHEWYMNKWKGYKKLEPHYNRDKFFQSMKKHGVSFLVS